MSRDLIIGVIYAVLATALAIAIFVTLRKGSYRARYGNALVTAKDNPRMFGALMFVGAAADLVMWLVAFVRLAKGLSQ